MSWVLAAIVGLIVGLMSTFLGLGGGVIMVPLLPSIFDLDVREAVATSIFIVVFVSGINCLRFYRLGQLDVGVGLLTGLFAGMSSYYFGTISFGFSESFIFTILACVLAILAVVTILPVIFPLRKKVLSLSSFQKKVFAGGFGAATGFLNGVIGVGGGIIMSPVLLSSRIVRVESVVPTTNLIMFLASVSAATAFYLNKPIFNWPSLGWVRLDIGFTVFAAAFITSRIGAKRQAKLNDRLRRILISIMLVALFIKIIISHFTAS